LDGWLNRFVVDGTLTTVKTGEIAELLLVRALVGRTPSGGFRWPAKRLLVIG